MAIESALKQEVEKEIILIDDCSKDNTRDIIRTYLELDNVKLICNPSNQGVAKSRNIGVQNAQGDYIAFLDADDYWEKDKLVKQLQRLQETGGVFCYTGRKLITEEGNLTGQTIHVRERSNYETLSKHNDIACSSVVMKRSLALEVPMEHEEVHEDYLNWLRILKKGYIAYGIDEPLLYYRLSEGGKSRSKLKSAKMTYGVHRYMGAGRIQALYLMCSHLSHALKKYRK